MVRSCVTVKFSLAFIVMGIFSTVSYFLTGDFLVPLSSPFSEESENLPFGGRLDEQLAKILLVGFSPLSKVGNESFERSCESTEPKTF